MFVFEAHTFNNTDTIKSKMHLKNPNSMSN